MGRAMVMACLPWLGLLLLAVAAAWGLIFLSGARWQGARLRRLHQDQSGAVQSLSFVLVLPLFVMVMLFIVQVSQLMIATGVVQYAAFAAARAAIVWIPANLGAEEANCISSYMIDRTAPYTKEPIWDPEDPAFGPSDGSQIEGLTYVVLPGSPKYEKIWSAAVLACMPICPSRDLGLTPPGNGSSIAALLNRAYLGMVPTARSNARISARIHNKLAYAMANTQIEVRFFHSNTEPPLQDYSPWVRDDRGAPVGYAPNELAWRDPITVTVYHQFALLPGPGRFLSRPNPRIPSDTVDQRITLENGVYKYPIVASATLGNEGEKSVIPYYENY